uniref:Uncharacterized protein n=1 Tax=Setaria digitata TaxID=48799 RepID=A0A915PX97_9BILA
MNVHFTLPFTLILTSAKVLHAIQVGNNTRFNIEILRHNPCHYVEGISNWNRSLEFESGDYKRGPQLREQPDKPGCYIVAGRMDVTREFKSDFSVYTELRTSASRRKVGKKQSRWGTLLTFANICISRNQTFQPAEPCINQQPDGCGGYGSCLYCDTCNKLNSITSMKIELLSNGEKLNCETRLSPGIYDDIQLSFCLPQMEALKTEGLGGESFLSLLGLGMTNESLPADIYWSLPFNEMIKNEKLFVACHNIHGNVEINPQQ